MAQKTGNLNIEYLVTFDDGFKPGLRVYCRDESNEKKVIIEDSTFEVKFAAETIVGNPRYPLGFRSEVGIKSKGLEGEIGNDKWEDELIEICKKHKWNLARVSSVKDFEVASKRHGDLYKSQFDDLSRRFRDLAVEFITANPGYISSTFAKD